MGAVLCCSGPAHPSVITSTAISIRDVRIFCPESESLELDIDPMSLSVQLKRDGDIVGNFGAVTADSVPSNLRWDTRLLMHGQVEFFTFTLVNKSTSLELAHCNMNMEDLVDHGGCNSQILQVDLSVRPGYPAMKLYFAMLVETYPDQQTRDLMASVISRLAINGDRNTMISALEQLITAMPHNYVLGESLTGELASVARACERDGMAEQLTSSISLYKLAQRCMSDHDCYKAAVCGNLGVSYEKRFEQHGKAEDLEYAIEAHKAAVAFTQDGHPDKPGRHNNIGNAHLTRFEQHGSAEDLELAIEAYKAAVGLTQDVNPDMPGWHTNLGNSYLKRFEQHGKAADLELAIEAHNAAVMLTQDGHPDKPSFHNNLGNSYLTQFEQHGKAEDLELAIKAHKAAVALTQDGHPDMPGWHTNLGNSHLKRFELNGKAEDLELAIEAHKAAVMLTQDVHPDKPGFHTNLGNSYLTRFEQQGKAEDLECAIEAHKAAVALTQDGHSDEPIHHNNLGSSFLTRFKQHGKAGDLELAIEAHQAAVALTQDGHPDKPGSHNNLGNSYITRFEQHGIAEDLELAIETYKAAVALTQDGHPDKPSYHNNLGSSFLTQFKQHGRAEDLELAIEAQNAAVMLTQDGHPDKPSFHHDLGNSYLRRFEQHGKAEDLELSIEAYKAAVALTQEGHSDKPGRHNSLGNSHLRRFLQHGKAEDLELAIEAYKATVGLTQDGHPDMPGWHTNLGNSHLTRFELNGKAEDLELAIEAHKAAVMLTQDVHPDKPGFHNNLGNSYLTRFEQHGKAEDLELAFAAHKAAAMLTKDSHPDKPSIHYNLGNAYLTRFEQHGKAEDSELAAHAIETAIQTTAHGHPEKCDFHRRFARLYLALAKKTPASPDTYLIRACNELETAAEYSTGPPKSRFRAAMQWAQMSKRVSPMQTLRAYACAIDMLPRMAWLGLPVSERHSTLSGVGNAIGEAAAFALEVGEFNLAIEWLEQGRSVVWGQIMQLRGGTNIRLPQTHKLAVQFSRVAKALLGGQASLVKQPQDDLNRVALHYLEAITQYDQLVSQIREEPGLEGFLRPTKAAILWESCKPGPVVLINVSEARCDALVLVHAAGLAKHIPLPEFSIHLATQLQISMQNSGRLEIRKGVPLDEPTAANQLVEILSVLWSTIVQPVLAGIGITAIHEKLPHIWWCPTGPLTFLPLHAAGNYSLPGPGHVVSDFVVSSYTPTLTALVNAQSDMPTTSFKLLAVSQSATLPGTTTELKHIESHAGKNTQITRVSGQATKAAILKDLPECTWAHFACHGVQDQADPIKSGLQLYDGRLSIQELIHLDLKHAEFVFLSACQTATGDSKLSNEAIHLAASMLLAGYRSVIATMWSIQDHDAPVVADEVYRQLFDRGMPDAKRAARALHDAVQILRKNNAPFSSWVPFVHLGM